jgi:hypothetical protein
MLTVIRQHVRDIRRLDAHGWYGAIRIAALAVYLHVGHAHEWRYTPQVRANVNLMICRIGLSFLLRAEHW